MANGVFQAAKTVFKASLLALAIVALCVLAQDSKTEGDNKKDLIPLPKMLEKFFKEECFIKFQLLDFSDMDCIKFTITRCIGMAIVVGSGILKMPQIVKILQNSSVEGLSQLTLYIETMIFMQTAGLGRFNGLSFTVYGESLIIMVQNYIIILLIWSYNKSIGFVEKLFIFVFMIGYAILLFDPMEKNMLQNEHWKLITSMGMIMNIIAKVPQIYKIFCNKSTGALAFFSFFLNFAGSIARCATVLIESDDFAFRLQYILGVFLNTIIIFQFFLYWNSSPSSKASKTGKVQPSKTGTKEKKNKLE